MNQEELVVSDSSSYSKSFDEVEHRGRKRDKKASAKKFNREQERQMNINIIEGLLPEVQPKLTTVK